MSQTADIINFTGSKKKKLSKPEMAQEINQLRDDFNTLAAMYNNLVVQVKKRDENMQSQINDFRDEFFQDNRDVYGQNEGRLEKLIGHSSNLLERDNAIREGIIDHLLTPQQIKEVDRLLMDRQERMDVINGEADVDPG